MEKVFACVCVHACVKDEHAGYMDGLEVSGITLIMKNPVRGDCDNTLMWVIAVSSQTSSSFFCFLPALIKCSRTFILIMLGAVPRRRRRDTENSGETTM